MSMSWVIFRPHPRGSRRLQKLTTPVLLQISRGGSSAGVWVSPSHLVKSAQALGPWVFCKRLEPRGPCGRKITQLMLVMLSPALSNLHKHGNNHICTRDWSREFLQASGA